MRADRERCCHRPPPPGATSADADAQWAALAGVVLGWAADPASLALGDEGRPPQPVHLPRPSGEMEARLREVLVAALVCACAHSRVSRLSGLKPRCLCTPLHCPQAAAPPPPPPMPRRSASQQRPPDLPRGSGC